MSARVCGAFSQVMQSGQRSSTTTTSEPLASQRSGWRNVDPQRGHMVIAATAANLRTAPDGLRCLVYQAADTVVKEDAWTTRIQRPARTRSTTTTRDASPASPA